MKNKLFETKMKALMYDKCSIECQITTQMKAVNLNFYLFKPTGWQDTWKKGL